MRMFKKMILGSLLVVSMVLGLSTITQQVIAADMNLVPNPSFETANAAGTLPTSWSQIAKGANTVGYKYQINDAHTGTRSAVTSVSAYTSGMLGWSYDSQLVTPGTTYDFSDWYKSTAPTSIAVTLTNSNGSKQVVIIAAVDTHGGWTNKLVRYTIPAGITQASFSHVLTSNGILNVDDFNLVAEPVVTQNPTPPPATSPVTPSGNIIANPSAETANTAGTSPVSWSQLAKGTNTAGYKYQTASFHTGTHSLVTSVTNYTGGMLGWVTATQPVTAGATYEISDWYQSTAPTSIIATLTNADGTTQTVTLASVATHGGWTNQISQYTIPAGVTQASFSHVVTSNGGLTVDDFDVEVRFNRPIVTLTYDDDLANQYTNVRPLMNQYGFKGTYYIITNKLSNVSGYMPAAQVQTLYSEGNEIGSHSVSHPDLTSLNTTDLNNELQNSQAVLQTLLGVPVTNFAAPNGTSNATTNAAVMQYYQSQRLTSGTPNYKSGFNAYALHSFDITNTVTAAQAQGWIDQAISTNTWLIILVHGVNPNASSSTYTTTNDILNSTLSYLQARGVAVETTQQALTELKSQL